MNKLQKLNLMLKYIKEHNLTAYEIGKNTKISTFAIQKIIKGETKNPNETTIDTILVFIEKAITGTNIKQDRVEESKENYYKESSNTLLNDYQICLNNSLKLMKENQQLKHLLLENNIKFDEN